MHIDDQNGPNSTSESEDDTEDLESSTSSEDAPLSSLLAGRKMSRPTLLVGRRKVGARKVSDASGKPAKKPLPSYFSDSSGESVTCLPGIYAQQECKKPAPCDKNEKSSPLEGTLKNHSCSSSSSGASSVSGLRSQPFPLSNQKSGAISLFQMEVSSTTDRPPASERGSPVLTENDEVKTLVPSQATKPSDACAGLQTPSAATFKIEGSQCPPYQTIRTPSLYWKFEGDYQLESPLTPNTPYTKEDFLARSHHTWSMPAIRPAELLQEPKYPLTDRESKEMDEMCFDSNDQKWQWYRAVHSLLESFPAALRQKLSIDLFPPEWDAFSEEDRQVIRRFSKRYNKFLSDYNHRVPRRLFVIFYYLSKVARVRSDKVSSGWIMDKDFNQSLLILNTSSHQGRLRLDKTNY